MGATRSPATFIQSSVRWSLHVHNGPILPSASMPVAPWTRLSSRPHPSREQIPIAEVVILVMCGALRRVAFASWDPSEGAGQLTRPRNPPRKTS